MKAEELLKELAACQSYDLPASIGFVAFEDAGEVYLAMGRRVKGEFKHVPIKVSAGGLLADPEKLRKALGDAAEVLGVKRTDRADRANCPPTDSELLRELLDGFFHNGEGLEWRYIEGTIIGDVLNPELDARLQEIKASSEIPPSPSE